MRRRFVNSRSLKKLADHKKNFARLPYVINSEGEVIFGAVDGEHKEIVSTRPTGLVRHMGYFNKLPRDIGDIYQHIDFSQEYTDKYKPVPEEVMGEIEAHLKGHISDPRVRIARMHWDRFKPEED